MKYEVTVKGIEYFVAHVEADDEDDAREQARTMWENRDLDPYECDCEITDVEKEDG